MYCKFCATCGHLFVSEESYLKHLNDGKSHLVQEVKKAKETPEDYAVNVQANDVDNRIAQTMGLRELKKTLRKAGIDCNTMNEEEAREAFRQLEEKK